jgi:hypothetical protein
MKNISPGRHFWPNLQSHPVGDQGPLINLTPLCSHPHAPHLVATRTPRPRRQPRLTGSLSCSFW